MQNPKEMTMTEMAARIAEIKTQLEAVKPLYDELDIMTVSLSHRMREENCTESMIHAGGDKYVEVIDNFAEKNTVFRPAGVKRFEAAVVTTEELEKRAEKAAKKASKGVKNA